MRIAIATGNPHKVEEMRRIFADPALGLAPLALEFVGLSDLPGAPFAEPTESGSTFEQNATIKALAYAQATSMLCLADDSGLEIDALDGRPGVISSHYCTDGEERGMSRGGAAGGAGGQVCLRDGARGAGRGAHPSSWNIRRTDRAACG